MPRKRQLSTGNRISLITVHPDLAILTMIYFRARSNSRNRQFFIIPEEFDINSNNDVVINSVIAWSFYPKLLTREGKGWRNVSNNQTVTLHPTSVNKRADHSVKWLSYYHIMQARNRNLNAHDTSAVDDFAIALLCGDAEFKVGDPF
jgi:ATP-dependent RNA helicase DHX29